MKTTSFAAALCCGSLLLPGTAGAVPLFYSDEATFIADLGAHSLETFESEPTGLTAQTYTTASGLVVQTSGITTNEVRDSAHTFGPHNTTPAGSHFLFSLGDAQFHDPVVFSHTGGTLHAWGANFTDLDFGSIEILVDGISAATPGVGDNANTMFFGFIGPMDFTEIQINTNDESWGIDDVRWQVVQVPEPSTLALFGFGLAGLGAGLRRKAA